MTGSHEVRGSIPLGSTKLPRIPNIQGRTAWSDSGPLFSFPFEMFSANLHKTVISS